ncbi:hypothetical protein P8452_14094 [Trifolium repens]|nr:hypothetical protein P8452_14094 [Trifolium repens]
MRSLRHTQRSFFILLLDREVFKDHMQKLLEKSRGRLWNKRLIHFEAVDCCKQRPHQGQAALQAADCCKQRPHQGQAALQAADCCKQGQQATLQG